MFFLKNLGDLYLKIFMVYLFKNDENVYEIFGIFEMFFYNKDKN